MGNLAKLAAASLAVAAGVLSLTLASAMAEELTFRFRNDHPNIVSIKLYSDDRSHVWPNDDEVYTLDDGRARSVTISCRSGEKVCYGAWVRNTASASWGSGRGGTGSCKSCCYICDGGETPILVLD